MSEIDSKFSKQAFPQSLRWILIDCPYDCWEDPRQQELFAKTIALKIRGYRANYPYGVLPVDTVDFVAVHQLICEETADGFVPITAYKSVTHERCKQHGLTFPAVTLARLANAPVHAQALEQILQRCQSESRQISWDASWTMQPKTQKNPELRQLIKDMFTALQVHYHRAYNVPEYIVGGTPRFKTDHYFKYCGYEFVKHEGKELSRIKNPFLCGEEVQFMHLSRFSKEANEMAAHWEMMWRRRITIEAPRELKKALKVAA